jgi:hypothetical protein
MYRMLAALIFTGALVPASMAAADCTCRGRDGLAIQLGDMVCLNTASGPRLARCEMVLNNSSWKVTGESCPTARATPVPATFSALPATSAITLAAGHGRGHLWSVRDGSLAQHY